MNHAAPRYALKPKPAALRLPDATVRLGLALLLGWLLHRDVCAQQVRLEMNPVWSGRPLVLAQPIKDTKLTGFSLTRFDGLLSELALQSLSKRFDSA
jgi:hypothetical protein